MTVSRRQPASESDEIHSLKQELDPGRADREAAQDSAHPDRPSQPPTAGVWGIHEVAAYLKIPVSSVYKMTARKAPIRIPHIRIGNKLRFRQSDVDRWLTLLTVSNLEALGRMHRRVAKVTHGNDSQAQAG